jgi:hypothetical protein
MFCLWNGHFVETRTNTGFQAVKSPLIHKVVHSLCGYLEKRFRNGYLDAGGDGTDAGGWRQVRIVRAGTSTVAANVLAFDNWINVQL